jgi:hypothetical protein
VHLHRLLLPAFHSLPAWDSHEGCLHILQTSIHDTCPALWAKLQWVWLPSLWTGCVPGLRHSCLAIWC